MLVLLPLTVPAVWLAQFWPAARLRLGAVPAIAAGGVLALVPVTVAARRQLAKVVGPIPAVATHQAYAEHLLPWAIAPFVVAAGQLVVVLASGTGAGRVAPACGARRMVDLTAAVVAVGAGILGLLVHIGDSGARAVWGGVLG